MRRLIFYSLMAHLLVIGLILTIPTGASKKVKPELIYRVSFRELPGSPKPERATAPSQEKTALSKAAPKENAPLEKDREVKKPVSEVKSPSEEQKKEAPKPQAENKAPMQKQNKETRKPEIEKKEAALKPEKKVEKEPSKKPVTAEKAPVRPEPEGTTTAKMEPSNGKNEELSKGKDIKESEPPSISAKPGSRGGIEKQSETLTAGMPDLAANLGLQGNVQVSLENVDFPYSYYLAVMQRKIGERWRPIDSELVKRGSKRVVIYFKVLKEGAIANIEIEESSGDEFLDRSAMKAILEASPMPPLPYEFDGEELGVHFGFEYITEG